MPIQKVFSYLVPPGKHLEEPEMPNGTEIPLRGRLFGMLSDIFGRSDGECDIPIYFLPKTDETQENDCRDDLIRFLRHATLANGKKLAERLLKVTTHKSGLGLLFIIIDRTGNNSKILIARFPAEQGIVAEEKRESLSVEFVEKVFMKNAHAYKSVLYKGSIDDAHFWEGMAVDRQIASGTVDLCDYWIKGFLLSDFKTTPKEGTKRLAVAIKNALNKTDNTAIQQELISAAILVRNIGRRAISINEFCDRYGISQPSKQLVLSELRDPAMAEARFVFDVEEFSRHILYKSLELDNGGTLMAQAASFDECFKSEVVNAAEQRVRFSTEGKIVNTKIRKRI